MNAPPPTARPPARPGRTWRACSAASRRSARPLWRASRRLTATTPPCGGSSPPRARARQSWARSWGRCGARPRSGRARSCRCARRQRLAAPGSAAAAGAVAARGAAPGAECAAPPTPHPPPLADCLSGAPQPVWADRLATQSPGSGTGPPLLPPRSRCRPTHAGGSAAGFLLGARALGGPARPHGRGAGGGLAAGGAGRVPRGAARAGGPHRRGAAARGGARGQARPHAATAPAAPGAQCSDEHVPGVHPHAWAWLGQCQSMQPSHYHPPARAHSRLPPLPSLPPNNRRGWPRRCAPRPRRSRRRGATQRRSCKRSQARCEAT
jgi:hypothetical protein